MLIGMYRFVLHSVLPRIIVAVMLGAFVPAVIAAAACETTCATETSEVSAAIEGHEHVDAATHAGHEGLAGAADIHMTHDGICSLSGLVCIVSAHCIPVFCNHVDSWSQPVEEHFVSATWPPPVQPPKN